jgi:pimeloyl-ACP methyl ester carboxylesterase
MRISTVLGIAIAIGCGGNSQDQPDAPVVLVDAPPDGSTASGVEPAACKFQVSPSLGLAEGVGYSCGNLIVDENRAAPVRKIRLHFIRFKSSAGTQNATIYLDGGPGGDGEGIVSYVNFLGAPFLEGLMADGDFLSISQRGTALSEPFLDCVATDCSDFASVADLPSYNTAYNADDIDELRAALGFEKLNLYGISYGSRLGLEVIRRHGENLRSVVIEGLVPAQTIWPAAIPASFLQRAHRVERVVRRDARLRHRVRQPCHEVHDRRRRAQRDSGTGHDTAGYVRPRRQHVRISAVPVLLLEEHVSLPAADDQRPRSSPHRSHRRLPQPVRRWRRTEHLDGPVLRASCAARCSIHRSSMHSRSRMRMSRPRFAICSRAAGSVCSRRATPIRSTTCSRGSSSR